MSKSDRIDPLAHYSRRVRALEMDISPDLTFSEAQEIITELKKTPKVK